MFLMYVDESGDTGLTNSPTDYFALSGIVIHESHWRPVLDRMLSFKRHLKATKGLKINDEIHCSEFISKRSPVDIAPSQRYDILKQTLKWISLKPEISIITIVVNKRIRTSDIFEDAWTALIQRFENTIRNSNFPYHSIPQDRGIIISDHTDLKKLTKILRKMRRYNPVPNAKSIYAAGSRNMLVDYIIEDPYHKDSANSFLHQLADVVSYFARQKFEPNKYLRTKGGSKLYKILEPVVNKKVSPRDPLGIVLL